MQRKINVVLATGGFDPIHSGHIEYFKAAKRLGDVLVVGLNSDEWLARKKGQPFMPFNERFSIIENLRVVDFVIGFNDDDGSSIEAIKKVREMFPEATIIFANGGDRTKTNIPENKHQDDNLIFQYGVGGEDKKNSSSWILQEYKNPKYNKPWGWYRVLDDQKIYKVKELVIQPNCSLSMQRHFHRSEFWYILKGKVAIETIYNNDTIEIVKDTNSIYNIDQTVWHRAKNTFDVPCHILEVQYGDYCTEEDIERKNA